MQSPAQQMTLILISEDEDNGLLQTTRRTNYRNAAKNRVIKVEHAYKRKNEPIIHSSR